MAKSGRHSYRHVTDLAQSQEENAAVPQTKAWQSPTNLLHQYQKPEGGA